VPGHAGVTSRRSELATVVYATDASHPFGCFSPTRSSSASSESASATKSSKPTAPSASPTTTATPAPATPPAAPAPTAESSSGNDDRKTARTRTTLSTARASSPRVTEKKKDDKEDDEDRQRRDPTAFSATRRVFDPRFAELRRCQRGVEREVEFPRKALRRAKRYEFKTCAVVSGDERGSCFPADVARVRIGNESFRAATRRDETMSASILARLLWNEKDDSTGVPRRIARIPDLADLPLPSNLQRDFLHIARADVGKGDDCHLAARFRAHIFRDPLYALHHIRLQNVREIVHQPGRRRDLDALRK
jgi:hypothetical protein